MKPLPVTLLKTEVKVMQVEVQGETGRAFVLTHHWKEAKTGRLGVSPPLVLSPEALEDLVQRLQQALVMSGRIATPPEQTQ